MANNILVSCGGKWVGVVLQLMRAARELEKLRGANVIVADRSAVTPAGCFAHKSVVVPPIDDPGYVDVLLDVCQLEGVGTVIPLIDIDLVRLAPHRHAFAQRGIQLVAPNEQLVELCFDKSLFARFADQEGVPVPRSFSSDKLTAASYPLFHKPVRGFGSQGLGVCQSVEEAQRLLLQRPAMIFQEFIDAAEASVDAYVTRTGVCSVLVPRQRDKVIGGEVAQSHTIGNSAVTNVARKTIQALTRRGFSGPLNLQLFLADPPLVIEVNPRLGSGCVLSNVATGGRLLGALLAECCGAQVSESLADYEVGLHLYRYQGDVIHDGQQPTSLFPEKTAA